jgi:hypothetical protein
MREAEYLGNVAQCNTNWSPAATRWGELLLIVFGSAWAHSSHGANSDFACAKVAPSELYTPKYGRVGDSNVCEGYYDKTVSRPFIELVSLTTVPPKSIAAVPNNRLRISTPGAPPGALSLLIQPFSVANPYRVDALIVSPAPLAWDSGRLRQAMKSSLKDVGFVATASSSGADLKVAPVRVLVDATSDGDPVSSVYATVRVSDEASQLQWRGYPTQHAEAPASLSWAAVAGGHLYSEEWATVEIPMKTDGGSTTVEFKALESSNAGFRPLRFVIMGIDHAAH